MYVSFALAALAAAQAAAPQAAIQAPIVAPVQVGAEAPLVIQETPQAVDTGTVLKQGTPIHLATEVDLNSQENRVGDRVDLRVLDAVSLNGHTVMDRPGAWLSNLIKSVLSDRLDSKLRNLGRYDLAESVNWRWTEDQLVWERTDIE